jgi:hypothetical protein
VKYEKDDEGIDSYSSVPILARPDREREKKMAEATPAKLKNGTWGARVSGLVQEGDLITVRTRAGKTWDARVERVIWQGDGVSLVSTSSTSSISSSSRPRRRFSPCEGWGADNPHPPKQGYCADCAAAD